MCNTYAFQFGPSRVFMPSDWRSKMFWVGISHSLCTQVNSSRTKIEILGLTTNSFQIETTILETSVLEIQELEVNVYICVRDFIEIWGATQGMQNSCSPLWDITTYDG